ncbi:MAG: hypothetical protein ACD_22C00166G0016 [uncultured bacterium]|nr:MAG: hypothetical protein ACD_22C00166G0016 [uncultured bacterium]
MKQDDGINTNQPTKGLLASAKNTGLDTGVTAKRPIDWDDIAKKAGSGGAILAVIGFMISCIIFLFDITKDMRVYREQEISRILEIKEAQNKLEIKVNSLEQQITKEEATTYTNQVTPEQ